MSRKHGILPDTQAKPGVPLNHMSVIVHVGDHWDMPSLSTYDKGTARAEGKTYLDDIEAGNQAMDMFMKPIRAAQERQRRRFGPRSSRVWRPRLVFCLGNHEQRIMRHVNYNPELRGQLGYHSFNLVRHGWEVHDFLKPVVIDGVSYQHYVPHPNTGKPWGGAAERRLTAIGFSHTAGHEQGKKSAERYLQDGKTVHRNLIVGSYYLHDEEYKGKMGNHHWRGIIMKHEVTRGKYDLMEVSMSYLSKRYHNKYPNASRETVRYVPSHD
jgi:hypothetical protein